MAETSLKKIASSREMILTVIIFLGIFIIFYRFFFDPQSEKIEKKNSEIVKLDKKIKALEKQNKVLLSQRKVKKIKYDKSANQRLMILKGSRDAEFEELSDFLNFLAQLSSESGLTLGSLSTSKSSSHEGYQRSPIELKAIGQFKQILSLLTQLDFLEALLAIESIDLLSDPMIAGQMVLTLNASHYKLEDYHAELIQK